MLKEFDMKRNLILFIVMTIVIALLSCQPAPAQRSWELEPIVAETTVDTGYTIVAFTSRNCPACLAVKKDLDRLVTTGYRVRIIDAATVDGAAQCRAWNVRELPTYLVTYNAVEIERVTYADMRLRGAFAATVAAIDRAKKKSGQIVRTIVGAAFRAVNRQRAAVVVRGIDGGYIVRYVDRSPAVGYAVNISDYRDECVEPCEPVRACDVYGQCVDDVRPCEPVESVDPVDPCEPAREYEPVVATPFE